VSAAGRSQRRPLGVAIRSSASLADAEVLPERGMAFAHHRGGVPAKEGPRLGIMAPPWLPGSGQFAGERSGGPGFAPFGGSDGLVWLFY
jgi:hypothetical protein